MRDLRLRGGVAVAVAAAAFVLASAAAALTPSDPLATHPAYEAVNLPAAWDLETGSASVVIAVVDSGVDPEHPDLADAVIPGYDFVSDLPGATPVDGHGTGVAGTAAARASNGVGGVGACFECSVLPLQVVGAGGIALNANIARAIDYAVDRGVAVVNISLIGPNSPPELERAISRARAAGVLVVAAAGNDARDTPQFPAAVPGATSVGASTYDGRRASFSNHGSWVKFAAPECAPIAVLGGLGGVGCGTSISAPLVAGIVALMRAQAPYATADDIEARLARTSRAVPGTVFGVPDAAAALRLLGSPPPRMSPVVQGTAILGSTLEAFSGIWVGSGLVTSYQWERCRDGLCTAIVGATGSTYAVTSADAGRRLRAVVTVEGLGSGASLQTATAETTPRFTTLPSIAGQPRVGVRLRAIRGAWEGGNLRFAVAWQRCSGGCSVVARGSTYRVRPADRGSHLRIVVTASNAVRDTRAASKLTGRVR
jgi:hypothetical protein